MRSALRHRAPAVIEPSSLHRRPGPKRPWRGRRAVRAFGGRSFSSFSCCLPVRYRAVPKRSIFPSAARRPPISTPSFRCFAGRSSASFRSRSSARRLCLPRHVFKLFPSASFRSTSSTSSSSYNTLAGAAFISTSSSANCSHHRPSFILARIKSWNVQSLISARQSLPFLIQFFNLFVGTIQAFVFTLLAIVYLLAGALPTNIRKDVSLNFQKHYRSRDAALFRHHHLRRGIRLGRR